MDVLTLKLRITVLVREDESLFDNLNWHFAFFVEKKDDNFLALCRCVNQRRKIKRDP